MLAEKIVSTFKPWPRLKKAACGSAWAFASPLIEMLVGVALFGAASVSFWMTRAPNGIALLWPGTAIAAALLIRLPQVRWKVAIPAVLIAALLANMLAGHRSWDMAAQLAAVSGLEISLMVVVFRFLLIYPYPHISINNAAVMTAFFGCVFPGVGALVAGSVLHASLGVPYGQGALQWWSSHAVGACLLGPPIILFSLEELERLFSKKFRVENILTMLLALAGCYLAICYVRFPFVSMGLILLIASFRLGGFGASLMSLACGMLITTLWLLGVRPLGLDPATAISSSLLDLPVIALLSTLMPAIAVGLGSDARRAAARELRHSEARYRLVVEDQSELISVASLDGEISFVNKAYAALYGREGRSMVGTNFYDHIPAEERPGVRRHLETVLAASAALSFENSIVTARGDVRWIAWTNRPSIDAEGRGTEIHSVGRDVTREKLAQQALLESEQRLTLITDNFPGLISHLDRELRYLMVNRCYADWFGVEPASLIGKTVRDFYGDTVYAGIEGALKRALTGTTVIDERELIVSGTTRHCQLALVPQKDAAGNTVGLFVIHTDITERRRAELQLRESQSFLARTGAVAGVGGWELDLICGKLTWSEETRRLHEVGPDFVPTLDEAIRFYIGSSRDAIQNAVAAAIEHGTPWDLELELVSAKGRQFWARATGGAEFESGKAARLVGAFQDITQQRQLSRELKYRAAHDALTGLVNRAEFEARLLRLLGGLTIDGAVHGLLYIDLDEFKVVNDACGHAAGDQLLRQVSVLLQGSVRGRDTVARLGGDEFAVLLESCSIEQAQKIAQKICDQIGLYRFSHKGQRYRIGTSIGVVPVDLRWVDGAAVMQAADSCCYAAKEGGRNRVHIWVESDSTIRMRQGEMVWANRLEAALDDGEFTLYAQHMQPIGGPDDRLHCEILLRLQDGDGALIPAGVFLAAAERFHMAARIDRWVVRRVIAYLSDEDILVDQIDTIAINLSGQSLGDRAFHKDLLDMISAATFDVGKLCFEITETAAITNLGDAKLFIDKIRGLGIRITLDDFGAGASSFGYLRTLPVDYLKIDGKFVTGMLEDPLDSAAVRCFCEVAMALGIKVIAAYVQSVETRQALQAIGVHFAQGYLIHREEPFQKLLPGRAAGAQLPLRAIQMDL